MEYRGTLSSAVEYAQAGRIEEWIHLYLTTSENANLPFSQGLKKCERYYFAPMRLPLGILKRCCGFEDEMPFKVSRESFDYRVEHLVQAVRASADIPPLIVEYGADEFIVSDGNHRHEAFRRAGVTEYFAIVWITDDAELVEFIGRYSSYIKENKYTSSVYHNKSE